MSDYSSENSEEEITSVKSPSDNSEPDKPFVPTGLKIPQILITRSQHSTRCDYFLKKLQKKYQKACLVHEKVVEKKNRLLSEFHRLELEELAIESKIRRLESPYTEWIEMGFDRIAPIPKCIIDLIIAAEANDDGFVPPTIVIMF